MEIAVYVSNRLGLLSFADLPLLMLYAGRNNILLWLTIWSHSTFLLLDRWVSYICGPSSRPTLRDLAATGRRLGRACKREQAAVLGLSHCRHARDVHFDPNIPPTTTLENV